MHGVAHIGFSFFITSVLSYVFRPDQLALFLLVGIISGIIIDLDHIYWFYQYHPEGASSIRDMIRIYLEDCEGDQRYSPRYHTWTHELLGILLVGIFSIGINSLFGISWAHAVFVPYLGHVLLDTLSVGMKPFSPFSQRYIFIGLFKPKRSHILGVTLTSIIGGILFLVAM